MERAGESSSSASTPGLPLLSLNHVSFLCKSLGKSIRFYEQILGFVLVQRPASLDFRGAWDSSAGIGESPRKQRSDKPVGQKLVMQKLDDCGIDYVTAMVEDLQLPKPPCSSSLKPPISNSNAPLSISPPDYYGKQSMCSGEAAALMMEILLVDMMSMSI